MSLDRGRQTFANCVPSTLQPFTSHPPAAVMSSPDRLLAADPSRRGVYCLREPIGGLWAYYNVTSDGRILHRPRPAEIGLETAFVVSGLFDELDAVDPVAPTRHLRLVGRPVSASVAVLPVSPRIGVLTR